MRMTLQTWRDLSRLLVLLAVLGLGLSAALGWWRGSVERFCPMGALATLPKVIISGRTVCAVGEAALVALAALLLLTLIARRAFCGWFCPVGLVAEWLGRLGAVIRGKRAAGDDFGLLRPAPGVDRAARWTRLAVLAAVVAFTVKTSELVFRPFCPYYVMTAFGGHDVESWSYPLLALVLISALVFPLCWCRYLCPLAAALWAPARVALLGLRRNPDLCHHCHLCDRACPQGLRPSARELVRSGECQLCLRCQSGCPRPGALELKAAGGWNTPRATVPVMVLVLAFMTWQAGDWFWLAAYDWENSRPAPGRVEEIRLRVRGVTCVHSGERAAAQLEKLEGIQGIKVFAARGILKVKYSPDIVGEQKIKKALEGPLFDPGSGKLHFNVFQVLEIMR